MTDDPTETSPIAQCYLGAVQYFWDHDVVSQADCPLTLIDAIEASMPKRPTREFYKLLYELMNLPTRLADVTIDDHATFDETLKKLMVAYIADLSLDDEAIQAETERRLILASSLRKAMGAE